MKIGICVPARDTVHAGFALCLANLAADLAENKINYEILINLGSVIPQQRNTLVEQALEKKCTHVLWIDSDMHFPKDILRTLAKHKKSIVAANYSTRIKPQRSVAFIDPNNIDKRLAEKTGLHQVWAVGMGCMLVDIQVYSMIGKPWYNYIYNNDTKDLSGEDIFFCKNANDAGYEVFVDADVSNNVAHYGTKAYLIGETNERI
jgi:hypothetical protein